MQSKDTLIVTGTAHSTNPQQWVVNYADYLYSYAIRRIEDEEMARDLVQETFLAALERLHGFEGRSTERTWLTSILKNKIIDAYRKKSSRLTNARNISNGETGSEEFFNPADGHWKETHLPQEFAREADDPLLSKEFHITLRSCMRKLPALWHAIFTMKHMDDLATEKICKELNITAANFWVIIHRTKVNLRACLQKNWI
ncbi:MAG: sigma-70 family RNA polymerase sigma factor [Sphingobacteriales bacterium]|nr:MAG: sigma-70 family RNA polymerase sigma factor [Sphingobacteriales bacterium]